MVIQCLSKQPFICPAGYIEQSRNLYLSVPFLFLVSKGGRLLLIIAHRDL